MTETTPIYPLASLHADSYSSTHLNQLHFWSPPVPLIRPQKEALNSSLRIGAIVSSRLFEGLKYEGEFFLLTPDNWQATLRYGKIDILIIESCWETATGHWYLSQITQNEQHESLLQIIQLASKLSIPSVFWNTQDHLYHNHYKSFSQKFDYIFCADIQEAETLRKQQINTEILFPAIQPAIHNPFKAYEHVNEFEIGVLFDGWVDLIRNGDRLQVLKAVQKNDLSIIESRGRLLHNKLKDLPEYAQSILGCVTERSRQIALKYAKTSLTFDASYISITEQQWRALEMAGFRLPVLYRGTLPDDDIRNNIVDTQATDGALLERLHHYQEDELDREKNAHLTWREVHSKHTFSHRIQTICQKVGLTHDWVEYPAISMITPTFRKGLLPSCVETFEKQKYPNKELIIIFNSNTEAMPKIEGVDSNRKDIRFIHMPQENYIGGYVNVGIMESSGEYCFKVDDDDYYGKNYISDILLHIKAIDADLFGKEFTFCHFEDESTTYIRKTNRTPLCSLPSTLLAHGKINLHGATIGGKKEVLQKHFFPDRLYSGEDNGLQYKLGQKGYKSITLDQFNFIYSRATDQTHHTWTITKEGLKTKMEPVFKGIEGILI